MSLFGTRGPQGPTDDDADRRAQERVPAGGLVAELIAGPGKSFEARVMNTSANGTRLGFADRTPPRFYMGTRVEVRFYLPGVSRPLIALGQIGNQALEAAIPSIGVRFVEKDAFYAQLTPRLWRQFNRRRRRRVVFEEERVIARLESGGENWKMPLVDLSEIGAALEAPFDKADELAQYELVRLLSELPGGPAPIAVTGLLIHQTPFGHGVRHGLVFDPPHSPDFAGQQERIARFVEARTMAFRARTPGEQPGERPA